jgi:hypothetical protein
MGFQRIRLMDEHHLPAPQRHAGNVVKISGFQQTAIFRDLSTEKLLNQLIPDSGKLMTFMSRQNRTKLRDDRLGSFASQ